jgi:hypothetical protein
VVTPASADDAGNLGNDSSMTPSISSDGRFVAYATDATDIVPDDQNGAPDIVLYDLQSGAADRLSLGNSGSEPEGDSTRPSISGDGTLVAYQSTAANLVSGDSNRATDVFVRDTTANPPPPPRVRCTVPSLIGLRLATAGKRITKAHCRVGRVRRAHSPHRVGRVIAQSPKPGTRRAAGTRVNLVVGRR